MGNIPNLRGIKDALQLVQGLSALEQEKLLVQLSQHDPQLAELLKKHLVSIDDLQYLGPEMFKELLKEIPAAKMALAYRTLAPSVLEKILAQASKWVREEIQDHLMGPKRSKKEVLDAQDELMKSVRKLISQGKIVLNKDSKDKWV